MVCWYKFIVLKQKTNKERVEYFDTFTLIIEDTFYAMQN